MYFSIKPFIPGFYSGCVCVCVCVCVEGVYSSYSTKFPLGACQKETSQPIQVRTIHNVCQERTTLDNNSQEWAH